MALDRDSIRSQRYGLPSNGARKAAFGIADSRGAWILAACGSEMETRFSMSTYVLIHGAQHGGWCWRKVAPLLEAEGHTVIAPDLSSHGDDKTLPSTVTLATYTDQICALLNSRQDPVVLLGHSAAGVAITQAAEYCPNQIQALVYLSAFLPRNGESLTALAMLDLESLLRTNIELVAKGVHTVRPEIFREAFYGHCSQEDEAFARQRLKPQAIAPLQTPVVTSAERWGRIPRYYIECTYDRAITLSLQRQMQMNSPCQQTFTINTDHSPFFSTPEELVEILARIGTMQVSA
jgi:pimeloyl-ACP methyl ester carboxylesterase